MQRNSASRKLRNSPENGRSGDGTRPETKSKLSVGSQAKPRRRAASETDLGAEATAGISSALNTLLADLFALYMKTKNFHWHMSGPHFRDFHLLLDDQAERIYAVTDVIA